MPLPKISTPTYELEIPSTKKKIRYRPFLVKEEKILIIAMESQSDTEIANAVNASTTVTFASAINSKISVGDEVFGTNLTTNPTISSIASDKLSIVLSNQVNFSANTNLKFVGSVDPSDTFVVAETVTFYDEGGGTTFEEDLAGDG